ncbi:CU044_5270 family protein [Streptomyces luteocolor]|uniref:CU044_5270 family protein n=1 Tax=Streptomyces luteocolor TaxID=285500 RepID=UPI000853EF18|nr:CU044_5270 family protein [Streptomyces luteocolor]
MAHDDELAALRGADPVPVDDVRFRDRALPAHAERQLNLLLHSAPTARPRPARQVRRLVWGIEMVSLAVAAALALVLAGSGSAPAAAAPHPLTPRSGSTPLPLDRLADRAAVAASADGAARLRRGTHVQTWSLAVKSGAGAAPITLPEERVTHWRPDGSHTELVVATDPRHPGKPVIADSAAGPRTVRDGKVLSDRAYPPSFGTAPPRSRPPHTPGALRTYLAELSRPSDPAPLTGTGELLDAVAMFLRYWTPGARETAALTRILAGTEGLRPAGAVTDRLGRVGQAYVHESGGLRRMLILDPARGTVLGLEETVTRNDRTYEVEAGDVMSYSAWMR